MCCTALVRPNQAETVLSAVAVSYSELDVWSACVRIISKTGQCFFYIIHCFVSDVFLLSLSYYVYSTYLSLIGKELLQKFTDVI